jgi:hypothetical protein
MRAATGDCAADAGDTAAVADVAPSEPLKTTAPESVVFLSAVGAFCRRVRFRGVLKLVDFWMWIDALLRLGDVARRRAQKSVDETDGHVFPRGNPGVTR